MCFIYFFPVQALYSIRGHFLPMPFNLCHLAATCEANDDAASVLWVGFPDPLVNQVSWGTWLCLSTLSCTPSFPHQALHVPRFENQAASTSHQTWPDNKIKPTVIWYSLQLRLVIKAHHHHDQRKHSFIIPAAFCAALYLQWCIVSLLQRGHYTWTPETKQPLLSQLLHNPVKPNQTTFLSTYSITWLVIFCSSFIFNMIITLW